MMQRYDRITLYLQTCQVRLACWCRPPPRSLPRVTVCVTWGQMACCSRSGYSILTSRTSAPARARCPELLLLQQHDILCASVSSTGVLVPGQSTEVATGVIQGVLRNPGSSSCAFFLCLAVNVERSRPGPRGLHDSRLPGFPSRTSHEIASQYSGGHQADVSLMQISFSCRFWAICVT